jgi:hypothetical protein
MEDVPESPGRIYPRLSPADWRRMAANVRWLKAWGHLRMKPRTFSRDEAFELARDVAGDVHDVVDLADLTAMGSRTPCIYNVDLSGCWIAYLTSERVGLGPSDVVVIDKKSGAVRFIGSANDEG